MNGETWTEYAVRWSDGVVESYASRVRAERVIARHHHANELLGRTVTATPWLPVQDQP